MLKLIGFIIVILGWLIYNILWFRKHRNGNSSQPRRSTSGTGCPGKKYAWTWMQTAGSLHMKYHRPESASGYPAISGSFGNIGVMIHCGGSLPGLPESTVFQFRFPCSAGLDLKMTFPADPSNADDPQENSQSAFLRELFRGRPAAPGTLKVRDTEILRCCMSSDCLDHLSRLSQIYPFVRLTDTELMVSSDGINNDLTTFRNQLETLLKVASGLKTFAEKASQRKKQTVEVTESQLADADFTCQKQEQTNSEPEPVQEPAAEVQTEPVQEPAAEVQTEPVQEPAEAGILEKSAFLRQLWSSGMNFQKQKEFFEQYCGTEVEWDGILKTSFPFSSDFVFGSGSGVKATFELAEFKPEGSFMPIRIKAVAAFSKDMSELFAKASGKHFRFRGKLLKIEPIAREIYLSDGVITEAES